MNISYDGITFISKFLRKPRVTIFSDIVKIVTIFIKKVFKDQEKLKELEIIYQKAIYICVS